MKYLIIAVCGDVASNLYYCIMKRCSIFPYGSLDERVESVTTQRDKYVMMCMGC